MLRHKYIDRVCCAVIALTLLCAALFVSAAHQGVITGHAALGYEERLFDQSRVHTIDIVMNDWEGFLATCTNEEYTDCHIVIDGEKFKNVAIRAKGNTSLSSVAAYGNNRYSFKVEFDHYETGKSYHGLDKLSLNNLIQDNTCMKDYLAYTLMYKMGVASPLCSFVQINVNGEPWGLYLAVEGVEDAFLQRNYGKNHGELYKPDSMSIGGGRGNGKDFDMDQFEMPAAVNNSDNQTAVKDIPAMPAGFDPGQMGGIPSGGEIPTGFDPRQTSSNNGVPAPADEPVMSDTAEDAAAASPADDSSNMNNVFRRRAENGNSEFTIPDMGGGAGKSGSNTDVKLQYTDDNPSSYANIFNNAKTDVSTVDQNRLIASLKALGEGDVSVVNTEAVIRYMAVHNFLCNDDSYTGTMVHNYYLYEEDGVLEMIPWDYNLGFGGFTGGNATSAVNTSISKLVSSGTDSDRPMAAWITSNEEYLAQYYQVYSEFMSTLLDSGWLEAEIDRVSAMLDEYVKNDPTAFCTYEEYLTAVETIKAFCIKRAQSVSNQLQGNTASVDAGALNLSAMGSMNRGGQGGFDRPPNNKGGNIPSALTGDSSGRSVAPAGGDSVGSKAAGQNRIKATGSSSSVQEKRAAPTPSFTNTQLVNQSQDENSLILAGVCLALLAVALIIARCYRANR